MKNFLIKKCSKIEYIVYLLLKFEHKYLFNNAMLLENFHSNNCIEMYVIKNMMSKLILMNDLERKFSSSYTCVTD